MLSSHNSEENRWDEEKCSRGGRGVNDSWTFRIDCKYLKHEVREEWQARWNSILYILFERILIGSKDRTCSRFGKITGVGHNVATDRLRRRRQTPEERLTSREVSNSIFTVVTPTFSRHSVASWSINARECECNVDNSDTHVSAAVSWFSHINCDINALPYLGAEPRACVHGFQRKNFDE